MWWLAGLALAGDVTVDADHLAVDDRVARADGHVVLVAGDQRLVAESLVLDLDTGLATLTSGRWTKGADTIAFATATVSVREGTGTASDAEVRDGRLVLSGATLARAGDGVLSGSDVVFSTCDCDRRPWEVAARDAILDPGRTLALRGARLRVLGVPVLWAPVLEVPLSRRSGLLAPAVGLGVDGLRVETPLYLTLGPAADTTLTPELRTGRGVRLLAEGRYALDRGDGLLTVAGGRDWSLDAWRGAGTWHHRHAPGRAHAAVEADWALDAAYRRDYRDAFLARATPFGEARAVAGYGPAELSAQAWQHDLAPAPPIASAGLRLPDGDLPGGFVGGGDLLLLARADEAGWAGGLRLARPVALGPLVATPEVRGRLGDLPGEGVISGGDARVALRLPLWRGVDGGVERLEPIAVAGVATEAVTPLSWSAPLDGGPFATAGLLWRRTTRTGFASLAVSGGWDGGLVADLDGEWSLGVASGLVQVRVADAVELATAAARLAKDRLGVEIVGVYADRRVVRQPPLGFVDDLRQVRATAWAPLGPLDLRLGARADPLLERLIDVSGGITWTHPTGCVALGATAAWAVDRPGFPDVRTRITVQPP